MDNENCHINITDERYIQYKLGGEKPTVMDEAVLKFRGVGAGLLSPPGDLSLVV